MTEAPPRPSSTILLLRDGASGLEVFMVVRHHQIDFASGALVFPGGSLDPEDARIAADPARCAEVPGLDAAARAFRVGAIRETFEECGVLLARPRGDAALVDGARCARLVADAASRSFAEMLAAEDLVLALDLLTPYAHWITPPVVPKRFDTHFFLAAAPADQLAVHDGGESVDSVWINPGRALREQEAGNYTIIFPTRLNLKMLDESASVAEAFAAARARTIVTVLPELTRLGDERALRIPIEAGYGGDVFPTGADKV
jgi:8-oxo-dGTP pyrophosphatase MutT (NUDIX family)